MVPYIYAAADWEAKFDKRDPFYALQGEGMEKATSVKAVSDWMPSEAARGLVWPLGRGVMVTVLLSMLAPVQIADPLRG